MSQAKKAESDFSNKDKSLPAEKPSRTHHRPLTSSFLWQSMRGAQELLRERSPSNFLYTDWMRGMGLSINSTSCYVEGKSGSRVPMLERALLASAKMHKDFIDLFFQNVYSQLFPGLNVAKAIEVMLLQAEGDGEEIDSKLLAQSLDNHLSDHSKIEVARQLLLSVNRSASSKNSDEEAIASFSDLLS